VAAAVAALCVVPIASADRIVSVGHRMPAALHGLHVLSRVAALRTAEVRLAGAHAERSLRSRPGIRFVQRTVSRSELGAPSFPLSTQTVPEWQWTAAHADLVPNWVQQAASAITIAVIDTGADVLASSLAAKSPTTWNIVNNVTTVSDSVGHGTFVASLAGGTISDPAGMSGFGGEARLMVVQANRGGMAFSDIDEANAIVYAVDHSANIINLSLGGAQTSFVERYAIDYATQHGVLLVAAAGNSAEQGNPTVYPAALLGRSGLVVGASNAGGKRASFSTTGLYVDVLAPGVDVLGALASGIPTGFFTPVATPGANGTYGYGTGTSYAAPEVAGAAALVWATNPSLDAAGVAATLEATAASHGVWTKNLAFGAIDIAAAVQSAAGGTPPTVSQPFVTTKPSAQKAKARAASKKAKRARP
jgi:subtilisin family serine protease